MTPESWWPFPLYETFLFLEWGDGSEIKIPFQDCPQPTTDLPGFGTKNWPAQTLTHTYSRPGTYGIRVRSESADPKSQPSTGGPNVYVTVQGPRPISQPPVPAKNLGAICTSPAVGNPINAETGNKFQLETDFVGGPSTFLEIKRYYNSQATTATPFGTNWTSAHHRRLTFPSGSEVLAMRPSGRIDSYVFNGAAWASDPDVVNRLDPVPGAGGQQTGWTLATADDVTEFYALDGKLLSLVNRAGLAVTLAYDASGRLATVTGPFAHTLTYAYNATGRIATITAPDGGVYRYGYGANGNLVSVTYPDGKTRRYVYENPALPNAMTGIIDEKNNRFATFAYDAAGRAISSEHSGGIDKYTVSYADQWNSMIADGLGRQYIQRWDWQYGDVKISTIDGPCATCGDTWSYGYDSNGYVSREVFRNNYYIDYSRDARGRELYRNDYRSNRQTTTMWHPKFRLPTKVIEYDRVTDFAYDAKGNLLSRTVTVQGLSRSWRYTYNASGQVLSENGPRTGVADVTRYSYDAQGNLATVTNPLGHVTRLPQYDGAGRPLRIEDPNGLVTTLAYDARGRLITLTRGTLVTSYGYDAAGNLLTMTMPDGSSLAYGYDKAQRLTSVRDAAGNRILYTLDAMGNRTRERVVDAANALVQTRTMAYDALDRVAKTTGAQSQVSTFAYDASGNLTAAVDPLKHRSEQAFDPLDRLVEATDPAGGITRFTYNWSHEDRLESVTDPNGNVTNYTYDALGNLTQVSSPDTGTSTYTYDAAGNAVSATDARGLTTTYAYDRANRLTKATFADGKAITFTYDQGGNRLGRLSRVSNPAGSVSWSYDAYGRLTSRIQTAGTLTLTLAYAYDAQGRLAGVTYPSGRQIGYAYDAAGRISTLTVDGQPLLDEIAYQPFGPASAWTWGNGSSYQRRFDADGRLSEYPLGADVRTLTYDKDGRITGFTQPTGSETFAYDPLDRLAAYASETKSQAFDYDPNGNRLDLTTESGSTGYDYETGSNRLAARDGALPRTYQHDAAGNITGDGVRTFAYDASGRLTRVTTGAKTHTFGINGLGQRVSKAGPGVVTGLNRFVHDDGGRLAGEYDKAGNVIQETVYFEGAPVAVLRPDGVYNVFADHLGTPRAIASQAGDVVWTWKGDPFGAEPPEGAFTYNLRFPGQYYDKETGLHYNYYRDYDPSTGRYVQSDPIGLAGGTNTFAYAGGNPISVSDVFALLPPAVASPSAPSPTQVPPRPAPLRPLPTPPPAPPAPGLIVQLRALATGAGAAAAATGAAIAGVLSVVIGANSPAYAPEPEDCYGRGGNGDDCSRASAHQLKRAGITDPHLFKSEWGGVPNSKYDICACKDGRIIIKRVGECGKPGPSIPTSETWK